MYRITKRFHFCYGHRLLDYVGPCAHPHGHNGLVEVDLESPELDGRGMVWDFGEISSRLKDFIDSRLDHQMILRSDDPLAVVLREMGDPVHLMTANPTAENLARLIYDEGRQRGIPVSAVRFWETPRNCAEYRGKPGP